MPHKVIDHVIYTPMSSLSTSDRNRWQDIDVTAALLAGLIAGVVDLALLAATAWAQGDNVWVNMRATAAILMGTQVLPPPSTFDPLVFTASAVVHFGLSLIYGVIVAFFVRKSSWAVGLMVGVTVGVGIYVVNFFVFAPLLFPWLIESRGGVVPTLIHPVFGMIAAAAYLKLRRAPAT
jgi:hypothetical protein